jgi:hypothetical protein
MVFNATFNNISVISVNLSISIRTIQTTTFRLRTGHNRLNQHLNSHENNIIPNVLLWRGRARYHPHFTDMQEPSGIERTTTLQEKLYGPVNALQKTTRFVAETEIQFTGHACFHMLLAN